MTDHIDPGFADGVERALREIPSQPTLALLEKRLISLAPEEMPNGDMRGKGHFGCELGHIAIFEVTMHPYPELSADGFYRDASLTIDRGCGSPAEYQLWCRDDKDLPAGALFHLKSEEACGDGEVSQLLRCLPESKPA